MRETEKGYEIPVAQFFRRVEEGEGEDERGRGGAASDWWEGR